MTTPILYISLWIVCLSLLLIFQYVLYRGPSMRREGMDNATACPPQPSDLDKLTSRMDGIQATVFDLSLNVASLQKNVTTLVNQQTTLSSSLKNSAAAIPTITTPVPT